jgi:hypothetical protein
MANWNPQVQQPQFYQPNGGFGDPSKGMGGFPQGGGIPGLPADTYGQAPSGGGRGSTYQHASGGVGANNTLLNNSGGGWMSTLFSWKGLAALGAVLGTGLLFHKMEWWPFKKAAGTATSV